MCVCGRGGGEDIGGWGGMPTVAGCVPERIEQTGSLSGGCVTATRGIFLLEVDE